MTLEKDGLCFHNVSELVKHEGVEGFVLQRVPREVYPMLTEHGQMHMREAAGVELRFVNEAPDQPVEITLSCDEGGTVTSYWGSVRAKESVQVGPQLTTILLTPNERLRKTPVEFLKANSPFDPAACRLVFSSKRFRYNGVRGGQIRPPRREELPGRCMLGYGTSITQGYSATSQHLAYASIAARQLNVDLINKGSAGSCHCEPEMADYLAGLEWDCAVLCLSVNMVREFTVEEFQRRAGYVVNRLAETHLHAPILCISILPWYHEWSTSDFDAGKSQRFREVLRGIVETAPNNVHLLDGRQALSDINGLCDDLLHPSDHGMLEIGLKVSARMKELLSPIT